MKAARERIAVVVLLALGLVVFWPAVRAPIFMDDYFQTAMAQGTFPAPRGPFDLYDLVGDADRAVLLDRGLLPWWTHPHLTVRFFRPLSSALLWADHRVFGVSPVAFHLHSFVWWAAAALAARALYRRVLGPRAALFATFVFALAPCHAITILWLANREALVSIAFGVLGLGALVRFRERERLADAALAALFFALALLGGEYAIGFGGYVLAMALEKRGSRARATWTTLAAFGVPAALYLAARAALGYGTRGSGVYFDPLRDPAPFLAHAPRRFATLLAESWLTLDADTVGPQLAWWALGLVVLAGVAILVVPVRRAFGGLEPARRAHATWLLRGSMLALVPVLAVAPSPRVLGASFLGVAAIVALVLERAWFPPAADGAHAHADAPARGAAPRAELSWLVALGLSVAHFVHGPGTARLTGSASRAQATIFAAQGAALRARLAPRDPEGADVAIVRGLDDALFALPYTLDPSGAPPARWRVLAVTGHVLVTRVDARTVEVVAPAGQSLALVGDGSLYRGEGAPFAPGDVVTAAGMRVTVLDVDAAGPRRARFVFDDAADAPSRTWLNGGFFGLRPARLPEPGFGKTFQP